MSFFAPPPLIASEVLAELPRRYRKSQADAARIAPGRTLYLHM